jgi:L-ribulose-5-phosphate 3-epimerase
MAAISRRAFLYGAGASAAASSMTARAAASVFQHHESMSAFNVSVLTDEISQDLGRALEVASKEFGIGWVDLREVGKKNIMNWDAKEVAEARRLLDRFQLRVACIASPIFKVDWPGAPRSKFSPKGDAFSAEFTFEQQDELLERGFELARAFSTDRLRIFDFWRLEDQAPHRKAIDEKVREAAIKAKKRGVTLVLENEHACNTATGAEAARLVTQVQEPALELTWDPGNAAWRDEVPFPAGYSTIPKGRIGHVHCKDAVRKTDGGGWEWMAMGRGVIDWAGQFRALKQDGYKRAVTLETHWRGAGTPEESTRQSMAGMQELLKKAGAA